MKTWLVTPSFCKAALLDDYLKHIYLTPPKTEFTHVIIDNHYPVDKEQNKKKLKELAREYNCLYVDSGQDLGLHRGLNNAMLRASIRPGDILIGCDPDDRPSPDFLDIMKEVMLADPKLAVCCLSFSVIFDRIKQGVTFKKMEIAGHDLRVHPGVEMWNIAGFNTHLLGRIGGFSQPNNFYGGIEIDLYKAWTKRDMYYGYLYNVISDALPMDRTNRVFFDPEYRQWKTDHVNGYKKSFELWLKERGKD